MARVNKISQVEILAWSWKWGCNWNQLYLAFSLLCWDITCSSLLRQCISLQWGFYAQFQREKQVYLWGGGGSWSHASKSCSTQSHSQEPEVNTGPWGRVRHDWWDMTSVSVLIVSVCTLGPYFYEVCACESVDESWIKSKITQELPKPLGKCVSGLTNVKQRKMFHSK